MKLQVSEQSETGCFRAAGVSCEEAEDQISRAGVTVVRCGFQGPVTSTLWF